jgi:type III secretion protein F
MSGIGSGFDYDSVTNTIGTGVAKVEGDVTSLESSMDPNSAADLIKMQMAMQKWSVVIGLESGLVKTIGDALKGLVQKIG